NVAAVQTQLKVAWSAAQKDGRVLFLPGGEPVKSIARLEQIYGWLADKRVNRDQAIVGVGGGTVLDLVGMAAATWKRGVPFIAVPTTLLAMVDAAIGGKTAINTAGLKNPVGVFHPATAILTDNAFLSTLSRDAWRDGLAEMIKTALIGDPQLFQELSDKREDLHGALGPGSESEVTDTITAVAPWAAWIARAAAVKADVVNRDFRETGPRRALNLGHTLGHVIEASSHQTQNPLSHGAAVAVGMAFVFQLAAGRGDCPTTTCDQVLDLLAACGLPITYPCPNDDELNRLLQSDKKASSQVGVRWVLPEAVGQMNLNGSVSLAEIKKWLT
ncbi:MAG: 3-dehydroquinate synthase, partial [Candidatus Krumholzibacteriia bacterium]